MICHLCGYSLLQPTCKECALYCWYHFHSSLNTCSRVKPSEANERVTHIKLTSESSSTSCSIDNTNCCVDLYPPLLSQIICHVFCFKHLRSYTKHARHFVASFLTRFCVTPLETIQVLACKCCLRFNIKRCGFRYLKSRLIEIYFSKYV